MKKMLILAAAIVVSMSSCKKDRTCTCTVTAVSSTVNGATQTIDPTPYTYKRSLTKVSKTGAHCNSGEQTDTNVSTSGGTSYTSVDVYKMDCTLE